MYITETVHQINTGEYVFSEPKSKRERRNIALSPSLAILLREYKAEQARNRQLLGGQLTDNDMVFSHPDGIPIRPDSVTRASTQLSRAVGLQGLRFHDLSHSHASLLLQLGVHPRIVSERLGHSSVIITLDTYSHVLPGSRRPQRSDLKKVSKLLKAKDEKWLRIILIDNKRILLSRNNLIIVLKWDSKMGGNVVKL
jgi:integrase